MTQIKIGDLVDTIYTSSLYPTISTPTRIEVTSKTTVDNIFYKDFTKKNMATVISDRQTQFLMSKDQITSFEDNRKKEVPKIQKFNKENLLADLYTNWLELLPEII